MNSRHNTRLDSRPVHPECGAHEFGLCNCEILWREWDGSVSALDRKIEIATRMEMRSRSSIHSQRGRGHGPDLDEADSAGGTAYRKVISAGGYDDSLDELELGGFWRESERLKVCAY